MNMTALLTNVQNLNVHGLGADIGPTLNKCKNMIATLLTHFPTLV